MLDLQLENLDLSYNRDMSPEDFSICGNIVKLLPVTNVRMFDCSLTDEKVEKLKSSLEEKQVSEQGCRFSSSVHSYSKKFKESSAITFHYEKDFDENGIIYWIGTNWRTALKWVNPAIHNLVHITSSEGRGLPYGKLEEVLSRDPAPLNCHTSNSKTAWICIDFRLWIIPSAYTLRHSRGYVNSALRNWLFQASKDGQTWITLYNHSNDTSLNEPGSTATWNITSHVGEKQGWRHFRLQQSGQTARKRTHYLSMSGLEIYGTVTGACEQLNSLDISCNSEITKKGFFTIGKITETSGLQNLTISDCEMTSQKLESLQEAIPERRKLNKLDVSYNDTLGAEGMSTLGSFVIKYEVEDVSLASCKLNEKLMESFLSSAQQSKLGNHMQIQQLNISHNRSIGRGIIHIARMINNGTLKRVNMSECMLSKNNVKAFCDNIQKPIQALNLSDSDRLVTIDYIEAICEVIPHISDELVLKFHSLTSACRSLLLDKLNSLKHSETRIILGNGDILNKRDTKAQTEKK
uniref:uncharacterized protein LOC120328643 n=1 Tax=Styela clava TaxID=7725 RepID=UPI00193ACD46|nr:uncharacterized protein LOC120328643 [Styela clava]